MRFKFFYTLIFSSVLISCGIDGFESDSRVEKLTAFHTVKINSVFNVYFIQDTTYSVTTVGFGEMIDKVSLTVIGDTLFIANLSNGKWLNPEKNKLKLYISADQLAVVYANAACSFETINPIVSNSFSLIMESDTKLMEANLDLNCNNFGYWNNYLCGGKLTLTGRVGSIGVTTFATMAMDAENLVADRAYIENNSKGDIKLFVNDRLDYSINGTGNIYLAGNPKEIVLMEQTSTGKLILR